MKRLFLTFAIVIYCTMATTVLTACSSSEDTPEVLNTPTFVQTTFTFSATQDMLDYCDITVKYNDGTGEKTESMTTTEWKKVIKSTLPATHSFTRIVTLKPDKDASNVEKLSYTNGYYFESDILNAKGESMNDGSILSSTGSSTISGAIFVKAVAEGTFDKTRSFSFDKKGNLQ